MPWVTIHWQDNGDLYAIGWPQVPTPYPGESMFGRVETLTRPDTRNWDKEKREYGDLRLRDNPLPVGRLTGREKPPMDPVVLEAMRLEAERVKATQG